MAKQALMDKMQKDYEKIALYYHTQEGELNDEEQKMLERWRSAYEILRKYPVKHVAIRKLMAAYDGLSESQAYVDVSNCIKYWNRNDKTKREMLDDFFIETIVVEITDNSTTRHKNLETLRRYLENVPDQEIDPMHSEKNAVYISFNINEKHIHISQHNLQKLSVDRAKKILESVPHEIIEDVNYETLND
jgi:hypothetical protein